MNKSPLKWAGNKFRVLPHILPFIGSPNRFCEPFVGSLSVALNVGANEYILNDINKDLINLYESILDSNDDNFINFCLELFTSDNNTREKYNELRDYFNNTTDSLERSRLFVYLNRHCFNGLSRYNSQGKFNVPFGKYAEPKCPVKEMMNLRMYFLNRKCKFSSVSFEDEKLYQNLQSGDVVYFDPPYIPISETASFTNYATEGFNHNQQIKLAELAKSLANRNVRVIISNHDVPIARELYKDAQIHSIQVSRTISAKGSSRKKANELIAVF